MSANPVVEGLLLVAHGSRDPRAAPVAHEVAAAVAARVPGLSTGAAFLELAEPTPAQALDLLTGRGAGRVLVQPFLLGEAYHANVDLPAVLALARARGFAVRAGSVLGPDPLLLAALERRLVETGAGYDAVVLAAAGSSDPVANAATADLAADLGGRLGLPVTTGFASAATPTVDGAVAAARSAGARSVAVATYLLAPGFFADRVARSARAAGAVAVAEPLGAAPDLVDLIVGRIGGPPAPGTC